MSGSDGKLPALLNRLCFWGCAGLATAHFAIAAAAVHEGVAGSLAARFAYYGIAWAVVAVFWGTR